MSKTVLLTGAGGFLGSHVAREFRAEGWRVIGVDAVCAAPAAAGEFAAYHIMALPNSKFRELLQQSTPSVLVHCAGRASVADSIVDPAGDFHSSVVLTFELLNQLREVIPACRFLFLSSAAVYGNPTALPIRETDALAPLSPYGFHKWQCEQLCAEFAKIYGLATASVRIFSAYGAGLRRQVIWDFCKKALTLPALRIQGTGHESRDFIHASDVARGLAAVATNAPMNGETYNLASGQEVTIGDLARMVVEELQFEKPLEFDGVSPAGNPRNWRADVTRISSLGFGPAIPFREGLNSVVAWCRKELTSQSTAL